MSPNISEPRLANGRGREILDEIKAAAAGDTPPGIADKSETRPSAGDRAQAALIFLLVHRRAPKGEASLLPRSPAIAADGDAYFDRPSAADEAALEHYLALSPTARAGDVGVLLLSRIAASSSPKFAIGALARLSALSGFETHLTPDAASAAIATLSMMGAEAHQMLAGVADQHPDAGLRLLAKIAIGRPIGHTD